MKGRKQSPFIGRRVPLIEGGIPILYPRYEPPPSQANKCVSKKKKRIKSETTSSACAKISPQIEPLMEDVATRSKRIKNDPDTTRKDTAKGHSKRDVLVTGSGDGNEAEALEIRKIMGFVPSANGSKITTEGSAMIGSKNPTGFSFGFTINSSSDAVPVCPPCTSISGETPNSSQTEDGGQANGSICNRRVLVGGMPYSLTPEQVQEFWSECGEVESVECFTFNDTRKFRGMACITFSTEESCNAALQCNGEYADGFQLKVEPWVELKKRPQGAVIGHREGAPVEAPLGTKYDGYNVAFVCNLPYELTSDNVKSLFKDCGVDYVRLHTKEGSNESRGFAHVHFRNSSDLERAVALDGMSIRGRVVRIGYAKPRDEPLMLSEEKHNNPFEAEQVQKDENRHTSAIATGNKHPLVDAVHISNLPFKACEADIKEFLHGCNISKVILPMKKSGNVNLGICIVNFNDAESCDIAVRLNDSRFCGRSVVIKYAKPRDVTRLRIMAARMTATQVHAKKSGEDLQELADLVHQEVDDQDDPLMTLL